MTAQPTPTGIAGAADHAPSRSSACHVCGGEMESPHALRAMPGVGLVAACSRECASADGFRSEIESGPNPWEETVLEIFDTLHFGEISDGMGLATRLVALIKERHPDFLRGEIKPLAERVVALVEPPPQLPDRTPPGYDRPDTITCGAKVRHRTCTACFVSYDRPTVRVSYYLL